MWELIESWEDICTTPLGESTALLLEFSDGCMLLVCASGDCSGDLEQTYSAQLEDTGNQFSVCELAGKQ